jgi:hypothetical protein
MRWKPLSEVVGFYGLVLLSIWVGQSLGLRGQVWIGAVLLLGATVVSSRKHGDGRDRLGLGRNTLGPAARLTLIYAGPALLLLAIVALFRPAPPWPKILFGLLGYPLWAFAQEYALLSFAANRLEEGLGQKPALVSTVNGLLFALVHTPNPVLMGACLLSGWVFTKIFLKSRNIFPLALAHALGGFLLSWILLNQYNGMMVGPAYWKWAGTPGPHP